MFFIFMSYISVKKLQNHFKDFIALFQYKKLQLFSSITLEKVNEHPKGLCQAGFNDA